MREEKRRRKRTNDERKFFSSQSDISRSVSYQCVDGTTGIVIISILKIRLFNGENLRSERNSVNCHRSSSVFDESNSSAYQRLKTLTQRLKQLEIKSRENIEQISLRKINSMSALNLIPMESSLRTNSNNKEKQISLEVKTNSYNRKIQVKTKQEDTICTMKTPSIVTRVITTETPPPLSPHRVSVIRGQRRSSSRI